MSDSIGKVFLDLETNAGPFQQQMHGIAGKSTNMVKAAFAGIAKFTAGAFAVTKLVQFGKASIDLASNLAEVQNVVDVVFGESADQINNFAKSALNAYGLSELSAKKYTSTMGAMLKSMGLSQDAVLNMSQSITALTGDMASFYNLDSETAFQKIRAGISGETEPLKQLGINMSVANMEAFALSQGITKSYQKMSQSEQALLRYNYLLSTTADAQGDFARTSKSWANQTRILSEQFNSLKATLGSAFIAVLTPVVQGLNWIISKLQIAAAYFKAFVEAVTGVKAETNNASSGLGGIADSAVEAGDATEKAAKKASKALAGFDKLNVLSSSEGDSGSGGSSGGMGGMDIPAFSGVEMAFPEPDTSGVEKTISKVRSMFDKLRSYITTKFAPSIKSWGNAFAGLKQPISDACVSVSNSLQNLWEGTLVPLGGYLLEEWVPGIVNSFSETVAPIFSDVLAFAIEEFSLDFEFMCNNMSLWLNDIVMPALELLKTVFTDTCTAIKDEWDKSGESLMKKFSQFRDSFRQIWDNLYNNIIKPVWDKILDGLTNLWDNHLEPLWRSLLSFFSSLGEAVMTVWNNFLSPLINWLIETFGPVFVDIFGGVWEGVQTAFGNIIDACKNVFDALGDLMDFITNVFQGDWEGAWENIKSFFKNIWDAMVDIVKAPVNLIIGFINAMLNGITSGINLAIKGLNKMSFTVPDWVPGIGGQKWGFNIKELTAPQIPYLAKGGIIDQPTLAMVGERGKEAVVPLENTAFADSIANAILKVLSPLFRESSTIGKNDDGGYTIVLKIGEYEFGRVAVGSINKYHNIVGKVELEV